MEEMRYVTEEELRAYRAPCGCAYPEGELVPCPAGRVLWEAMSAALDASGKALTHSSFVARRDHYFGPEYNKAKREYERLNDAYYAAKRTWDEHFKACNFPEIEPYWDEPDGEPDYEEPSGAIDERAAEAAYYREGCGWKAHRL